MFFLATEIKRKMNPKMDPCDNFYEFVCGNFTKNAIIPDDQPLLTEFSLIEKKIKKELKRSLENNVTEGDPQALKILQSYYVTCMNEGN